MEKNKVKELTQDQKERIWKREEDAFAKKQNKILSKQKKDEVASLPVTNASEKYKLKVNSKLFEETKAITEKKREKFDSTKETGRDAITMGGNILGVQMRTMPGWRQGV